MLRPDDSIGDNLYNMTGNTGSMRYVSVVVRDASAVPTFFCRTHDALLALEHDLMR